MLSKNVWKAKECGGKIFRVRLIYRCKVKTCEKRKNVGGFTPHILSLFAVSNRNASRSSKS